VATRERGTAIAREAGVTQPLINHHFGSKEGLWRAAMDELFSQGQPGPAPLEGSPTERFLAVTEHLLRFVAAHPEVTRVLAREGGNPGPRLQYLIDHYLGETFRETKALVHAGQRAGLISEGVRADLLIFYLLGAGSHLFDATALARWTLGIDTTSEQVLEDFVALFREVLLGGVFRSPAHAPPARRRAGRTRSSTRSAGGGRRRGAGGGKSSSSRRRRSE
jgi:AcrR family transcriptional regulator